MDWDVFDPDEEMASRCTKCGCLVPEIGEREHVQFHDQIDALTERK